MKHKPHTHTSCTRTLTRTRTYSDIDNDNDFNSESESVDSSSGIGIGIGRFHNCNSNTNFVLKQEARTNYNPAQLESKSQADPIQDSHSDSDTAPGPWTDISIDGLGVVDCIDYLNGQADVADVDCSVSDNLLTPNNNNNDSAKLVSVRLGPKYFKNTSLKLNESLVH
ncbi:hypothetical protein ACLKA7_005166 [Drosophila subpalustris]